MGAFRQLNALGPAQGGRLDIRNILQQLFQERGAGPLDIDETSGRNPLMRRNMQQAGLLDDEDFEEPIRPDFTPGEFTNPLSALFGGRNRFAGQLTPGNSIDRPRPAGSARPTMLADMRDSLSGLNFTRQPVKAPFQQQVTGQPQTQPQQSQPGFAAATKFVGAPAGPQPFQPTGNSFPPVRRARGRSRRQF